MPTYEFQCDDCKRIMECVLPITRAPDLGTILPTPCAACGGTARRIVSAPTFAEADLKRDRKFPYEAVSFDRLAGAEPGPMGRPLILSRSHEKRVLELNRHKARFD